MCKFYSAIVMKNGDLLHNENLQSHEDIIWLFNIRDSQVNCDKFVRVEFTPKVDSDYSDIEKYRLIVDETSTPDWFEQHREYVTTRLKDFVSKRIILSDQKILTGGLYVVKDCVIDKVIGATIVYLFGTVTYNRGTVTNNRGTVTDNRGTVTDNYGTVIRNSGTVTYNSGTVTYNFGTVTDNRGTVTDNSGTVTYNFGTVTDNSGTVTYNSGTVTYNFGTVTYNFGTVTDNSGTVTYNSGTVTDNSGTVTDNSGTVDGIKYNSKT
jgi:hypothetical protein